MHIWAIFEKTCLCHICEQQKRRSGCASAQSDQCLFCWLPVQYNTVTWYNPNFKTLASFCSWAGRVKSYLVADPEDRFSCDEAHFYSVTLGRSRILCPNNVNIEKKQPSLVLPTSRKTCIRLLFLYGDFVLFDLFLFHVCKVRITGIICFHEGMLFSQISSNSYKFAYLKKLQ